jgi:hypothetical protein
MVRLLLHEERQSKPAVTDNILDRDGESRVCSWKCGGTGGVARLFIMASCGCLCPNLKEEDDAGRYSFASTLSQKPAGRKVTEAASCWFEQMFERDKNV